MIQIEQIIVVEVNPSVSIIKGMGKWSLVGKCVHSLLNFNKLRKFNKSNKIMYYELIYSYITTEYTCTCSTLYVVFMNCSMYE